MKQTIRLTESQLRNMIKESVRQVLKENAKKNTFKRSLRESDYWDDDDYEQDEFTEYPETFDEIYNDGQWQVILGGDGGRNMDRCYYVNHPAKKYQDINKAWQYWDFLITLSDGVRVIDGRGVNEKPISPRVLPINVVETLAEDYYDFEKVLSVITGR